MSDYKSPLDSKPDYLVCTCMGVMYSDIVDVIKSGADSFEQLDAAFDPILEMGHLEVTPVMERK